MKRKSTTPAVAASSAVIIAALLIPLASLANPPVAVGKGLEAEKPKPTRIGKGKVNASTLNVRAKPGTSYGVVHTFNRGAEIDLITKQGEWYEIAAPEDMTVWVAANLIVDGVTTKDVNLRAGPGINHSSLGTLKAGTKVDALKMSRHGWMNIEAPAGTSAWVAAAFIDVVKPIKKKADEPKPAPRASLAQKTKPKPAKDTASFPKIKQLPFVKGEEKNVSVEGFLYPAKSDYSYVTHVVGIMASDDFLPLFYVHGDSVNLTPYERKAVRITGERRRVKGWKLPVIDAFTVFEISN